VYTDDVEAGQLATRHLLELGHSIAFVGDFGDNPYGFTSSAFRCAGFQRAMLQAGLEVRPEYRRPRHPQTCDLAFVRLGWWL
jgi:DNA-binding LacI/PurR family transcriptional regulator